MLNELDETIRQLLIKAGNGQFDQAAVDISFDLPNREWSKAILRPTINCYLFDIHERRSLREEGWRIEGRRERDMTRRKPLLFYDISYLITAWTNDIRDEHSLLWQVLTTLSRFPILNDTKVVLNDDPLENPFVDTAPAANNGIPRLIDCLPEPSELREFALREDAPPIYTSIAQLEGILKSPGEFWTALENELKPSLNYVITMSLDRQAMRAGPPVLSTGIRVHLPESTAEQGFLIDQVFQEAAKASLGGITVTIEGQNAQVVTNAEGRFQLGDLPPGRHTLIAEIGGKIHRRPIVIRAPRGYRDVVLDQNDQPLAGVEVEVEGANMRAITDAQGRFTLDLAPGSYTLRILMDGWSQQRTIVVRDPGYSLRLHVGGERPDRSKRAED